LTAAQKKAKHQAERKAARDADPIESKRLEELWARNRELYDAGEIHPLDPTPRTPEEQLIQNPILVEKEKKLKEKPAAVAEVDRLTKVVENEQARITAAQSSKDAAATVYTASLGVPHFSQPCLSLQSAVQQADDALKNAEFRYDMFKRDLVSAAKVLRDLNARINTLTDQAVCMCDGV